MNRKVLIVEDEPLLAKKIAKYLSIKSFDVQVAHCGQDGLDCLTRFGPDVVLLDYNLPGDLNGLQVLEQLRRLNPGIRVIMMTGNANACSPTDAANAGAFHFLQKPIVLSEIWVLLEQD